MPELENQGPLNKNLLCRRNRKKKKSCLGVRNYIYISNIRRAYLQPSLFKVLGSKGVLCKSHCIETLSSLRWILESFLNYPFIHSPFLVFKVLLFLT